MNDFYEKKRAMTTCSECGNNDMGIFYLYDGGGIVKKSGTTLGMKSYTGAGNMLMIACKQCGHLEKSFLIGK